MSHFIKTGYWKESLKGYKQWLNLERLIGQVAVPVNGDVSVIEDGTTIDVADAKSTLETSETAITADISYAGDDATIELTLNGTALDITFPATALCVAEGVASGDNVLSLSGTSGDKYIIGIKVIGANYYVVSKNFGQ